MTNIIQAEAESLATALERAITALNSTPSFSIPALCDDITPRMTSYKLLPELEKVLRAARGQ